MRTNFTDYEAAVIFATAARCGIEYAPSDQLKRERPDRRWLEPAIRRHGPDSVEAKWDDFRSPPAGSHPQARREQAGGADRPRAGLDTDVSRHTVP